MPDFKRYYNDPAYPTTVSRDVPPGEYSWDTVVYQSGRPVLDAELNLTQDAAEYAKLLIAGKTLPSGFLRSQSSRDSFADFGFVVAAPGGENVFSLNKQLAFVAGMPVVVEYTDTSTANLNLINLPVPSLSGGAPPDIKRTDFVFLEVWRTLVAPSPRAFGTVEIVEPQTIQAGDTVTVDTTAVGGPAVTFTAVLVPALPTEFAIGGSGASTASALATCINNPANGLSPAYVAANTFGTNTVTISAVTGGTAGNGILLSFVEVVAGSIVISGPAFTGGANRPNKPSQSQVYRHGNVDSAPATWLPDELVDPVINAESAQRVQVQYRLRTYSSALTGVNPKTEPDGFSNAGIEAQGPLGAPVVGYPFVPADNSTVSGSSDATTYGFVDNGLWLAGDGSNAAAIALGTVDGYVYAIPLCFVFRRNDASLTGGFDPDNTVNSGLPVAHGGFINTHLDPTGPVAINPGKSDRPDGLFADIIVPTDLLDLRRHVTPPGYDFGSEIKYQIQSLLDKKTATWQVDGSDWATLGNGSGDQSTFPLFCDQVGRFPAVPPPPARGNLIRQYDHVARRFASQSVVERIVFEVLPNAGAYPPGISVTKAGGAVNWYEGDQITIDFDQLNPTTLQDWTTPDVALAQVSAYWPTGTRVTDVLSAYHDDGISTAAPVDQSVQFSLMSGLGTNAVTFTLDANNLTVDGGGTVANHSMVGDAVVFDTGSARRVFIELEITYPTGAGLTQTPDIIPTPSAASGYAPYAGGPTIEDDPNQRPAEMDAAWYPQPKFRSGFREVKLEQKSAPGGTFITDNLVTINAMTVRTPRRFFATGLLANAVAPVAPTAYGSSARTMTLDPGAVVVNQTEIAVDYYSQDPVPSAGAVGYSTSVYYRTQAPQTAGVSGLLPTTLMPATLVVEPVAISPEVWTGQTGKGSTDLGYPYESPLDPIPVATGVPPTALPKEWYFSALADVTVADFSAATGLLSLHSFVQVDGTNPVQLGGPGRGPLKDPELRLYFDLANPNGYKPTAMAQPLFGATRHKTFQPMLVRSTVDTLLFRKGELLLLILSQFHELSADNKIVFSDNPAIRTSAAIYRTRNLLLTVGD
jgi:hypothetical protein